MATAESSESSEDETLPVAQLRIVRPAGRGATDLTLPMCARVALVKVKLEHELGVPEADQRLIYGGKVQKYVRGRKPKAAKKAAPKSPKPTRVQPKRSATPEPLSRKPSSPKKKPAAKPRAESPAPAKKPAVKKSPAKKPASKPKAPAKKPATRKAAVSPKKRGGSRATLEALASARSTPATRAELKTTLETLGVDFKSSDSTKYLQRKLENWLEEN